VDVALIEQLLRVLTVYFTAQQAPAAAPSSYSESSSFCHCSCVTVF